MSLYHGSLVLIGHFDPELVGGGWWDFGLTVCEENPGGWRVGGRVDCHVVDQVVGHDGGQEVMWLRWLMDDVYKWVERR